MHVYLHVPFCARKCHYCDFYSLPAGAGDERIAAYLDHLEKEIAASGLKETVETVYIGGGNPALLDPVHLDRLLKIINTHIRRNDQAEFSVELNPESVTTEKLEILRKQGINRLSFGLQSIHDDELTFLGRHHTFAAFHNIYEAARTLGFGNLNIDIIHGFPDNTLDRFKQTLDSVIALAPEHLSVYEYNRPDGSAWHPDFLIGEDLSLAMWELKIKVLKQAGYAHYEISNFCQANCECRHNFGVWQGGDYIGFGPAAHSRVGNQRWANGSDIDTYILRSDNHRSENTTLSTDDLVFEHILLGLRTAAGINRIAFIDKFKHEPDEYLQTIVRMYPDYFVNTTQSIRLSPPGLLVYDELLKEIFTSLPAVSS